MRRDRGVDSIRTGSGGGIADVLGPWWARIINRAFDCERDERWVANCVFAALLSAFVQVRGAIPCFLDVVVSCHTDDREVDDDKLLIVENVPLIAWFWEIACQSLLVETTTMHSGLDMRSRSKTVREFNQKGGLKILIIMYDVGGQAINLQRQCHHVIVATPAISFAKFLQAVGRVIRVMSF
jgi:hypothetical protein